MALRPDHLTIANRDRDAADQHYGKLLPLLGFSQIGDNIWHNGAGFYIQFIAAEAWTRPYERYGAGMNHVGFPMESVEAVESLRSQLLAAGMAVPDVQDLGGATALFLPDPDGLRFEFTYYPPGMPPVG